MNIFFFALLFLSALIDYLRIRHLRIFVFIRG